MKKKIIIIVILLAVGAGVYYALQNQSHDIVLTGIVTTDSVIVSSQIQGRLQEMRVDQGDKVKRGDLLALIKPEEWKADVSFYANSEQQYASQVGQAEADLKFQEKQTLNQIEQANENLASTESQVKQAQADGENAQLNYEREEALYNKGADSKQAYDQARTANDGAKAHLESLNKQMLAAQAALALAKSTEEQIAMRHAALEASSHQLAAAGAQKDKAQVQLDYTEIRAPIDGVVDVRAALIGEVVNPGQGIVTLINEDDLWVRADVEETYIDRIRNGQKMKVRLPSGAELEGTVFFRGIDADYATQRDVSRTKRDIKTFEVRLRCDNKDRALAVGMTAYVLLPL
ncbi:MAG: efflux RND transporter periplasmic adaptor subunit [Chthoniobacteraceae bacterium]